MSEEYTTPSTLHNAPFLDSTSSTSASSPTHYTPSHYSSTLPTPPSSSSNPFSFDPTPPSSNSTGSSSIPLPPTSYTLSPPYDHSFANHKNDNNGNNHHSNNMMTRAASSGPMPFQGAHPSSSTAHSTLINNNQQQQQQNSNSHVPPIIAYDPNHGSPSEDEDEDDDGEGVPGRPRKRKSTRDLRSAAQAQGGSSANNGNSSRGATSAGDDKDDDDKGRRKIQIEYIEEKSKRHITFSKRKAGIMKKAYELSTLTGTQVLLLVVSESGWVYTFTTDKFKPLVKEDANGELSQGQKLIAACLEAKEGVVNNVTGDYEPRTSSSTASNFEANSAVHGGQISLKTNQRSLRPTATNRRVSSKGRNHIPTAINTGPPLDNNQLPCPPGSGGIPPVPQLPTPLSGNYLDLASPISPRDPRAMGLVSPARTGYGTMQQQQAQAQAQYGRNDNQQGQDYAEMMHRAEMMQLQQGGYEQNQNYDLYSNLPPNSMSSSHLPLLPLHDAHSFANATLPQPPPHLTHSHSHSHSHSQQGGTPHRTLHHARSHPNFHHGTRSNDSASAYELYGPPPPLTSQSNSTNSGGGSYTHAREPSTSSQYAGGNGGGGMDPRQNGNGGYQTPMHSGGNGGGSQASSVHNTPHGHQQQHVQLYGEEQYAGR